jgi:hypothetical protein
MEGLADHWVLSAAPVFSQVGTTRFMMIMRIEKACAVGDFAIMNYELLICGIQFCWFLCIEVVFVEIQ